MPDFEIKKGGMSYIRISDDGCGMSREDVPVAIKRHATSKIHTEEDLNGIMTLGFRGEALAAIASVSRLRIMTKRTDDESGTLLVSEGGEVTEITEAGCRSGTTVIVEELFANVPARRKFLKRDASEAMAVTADVTVRKGLPVFDWGETDFRFHVPVDLPALTIGGIPLADYIRTNL